MRWRKTIGWTLVGLAVLFVFAGAGLHFYMRSESFRESAIHRIVAEADSATGGHTQVRGFDFDLSNLTAHLYGIVIHGKEGPDAPPFLQADELTVRFKIQSLLRRQVKFRELTIERPIARVIFDRDGNSNIPQPSESNASSGTDVFQLAVGHLALNNGEVDYSDRKLPLDAELRDLRTEIRLDASASRYTGSISYSSAEVRYEKYAPLPHSLDAKFTATPSLFKLESAAIGIGSSTMKLAAEVANFNEPAIQGSYDILLHSQDVNEFAPGMRPAGDIRSTGDFHYRDVSGQPFLKSVAVQGQLNSTGVTLLLSGERLEVKNFRGQYKLADGSLQATEVEAETLGGRVTAVASVDRLDRAPAPHLQATLRNVSLHSLQQVFRSNEVRQVAVSGALDGTVDASWEGSVSNIRARVDMVLRSAGAQNSADTSARDIPVAGVIHAMYEGRNNTVSFGPSSLRIPEMTVTVQGQVSKHSHLEVKANASDLHRLGALAARFRPPNAITPDVSGSATVNATIQGDMQKPAIQAHLSAANLHVQGSEWKSAELSLQAGPLGIVVSNGTLIGASRGRANFDVNVSLRDWSYLSSNPIQAHVWIQQMHIADLQHLANVQYPVSGELSAQVVLSGSQLDPRGSGSLEVANAQAYGEPLKSLTLTFHGENGAITSNLRVAANAGSVNASLSYAPKTRAYQVGVNAPAIVLQKLAMVQKKNLGMQGALAIFANGEGTLDHPQLDARIEIPELDVKQKSILGIEGDVHVANKQADIKLTSQVAQSSVHAQAHVDLTGDYRAEAAIDTGTVPLEVLLATFANTVPEGFSGQTEIHASLKGPLKDASQLEAHLVVPTLSASYRSLLIGAVNPLHADYFHSVVTLQPAEIRGTGTSLRVQGSLPLGGASVPNLTLQGSIDARLAQMISPESRSSGTATLDIRATGPLANPQIVGQLRLQKIAFATSAVPLGIDNLNGTLDLDGERARISQLTGQVGGGQVSIGGSLRYRPYPQFDIAVEATSVRLRYPEGLRSVLDGNLTWAGTTAASTLSGRVLVGALSFTPDFDISKFGDQFGGNAVVPAEPGFADTIRLQVAIQSKQTLSANSSQISVEGSTALSASGTAANPVITGRTDLTAGELFYRNVRYQLQRGIITFGDPNQTNPTLDVSLTTIVEQYNLRLNLRGPFDRLTTSYSSDPPLATADIINLIARGKTSSELAASNQSTDSMIASQAASELTGSLQKLAGISSLQVDPGLGTNNQNPSTTLAVQQRLTKNFLFTFSTDVSQPGNELVEGEYQINKRWSVSVTRDQLGGVSVDGRYHTKF